MDIDKTKSRGDEKNYRVIRVQSGLECLLVSTKYRCEKRGETNTRAAAAMAVQVGSFADPDVTEGCAHFLEHMVFMGSSKYPGENHYDAFVSANGGSCNAFTEGEHTVYQFDMNYNDNFSEALDIFGNCFIAPLLAECGVRREINAIESEFNLAKVSDGSRLQQLFCHQALPDHVLRKFSWGNLNSLSTLPKKRGVDVMSVLREFHSLHYTPENMRLVVLAPKSLEDLQIDVEHTFGTWINPNKQIDDWNFTASVGLEEDAVSDSRSSHRIKSKKQKIHAYKNVGTNDNIDIKESNTVKASQPKVCLPLDVCLQASRQCDIMSPSVVQTLTRVVPIKNTHSLMLTWQLPPYSKQYRSKPCSYICHLLGHEGPGSILSSLKQRNLASTLTSGISDSNMDDNSMYSLLEVTISLTDNGVANWMYVAQTVHHYLRMVKEEKPNKRIFDEMRQLGDIYYRFLDEEDVAEYAERLAIEMLPYAERRREDLLPASFIFWEWDPKEVAKILEVNLTVRKAKVTLMSSAFKPQQLSSAVEHHDDIDDDEEEEEEVEEDSDGEEDCSEESDEEDEDEDGEDAAGGVDETTILLTAERIRELYVGPLEWLEKGFVLPPAAASIGLEEVQSPASLREPNIEPHFGTKHWQDPLCESLFALWESDVLESYSSSPVYPPREDTANNGALEGGQIDEAYHNVARIRPAVHLPPPNTYIPEALSMLSVDDGQEGTTAINTTAGKGGHLRCPERIFIPIEPQAEMKGRNSASLSGDKPPTPVNPDEEKAGVVLWHLADESFGAPKAEVYARLLSPIAVQTARHEAMLDVLCRLTRDRLNEELYMASMADLNVHINATDTGIVCKVSGYSDKACLLMIKVLHTIICFDVLPATTVGYDAHISGSTLSMDDTIQKKNHHRDFLREVEQLYRSYQNVDMKAGEVARSWRLLTLLPRKYPALSRCAYLPNPACDTDTTNGSDDHTTTASQPMDGSRRGGGSGSRSGNSSAASSAGSCSVITPHSLETFMNELVSNAYLECFVHGNISRASAVSMVETIIDQVNSQGEQQQLPGEQSMPPPHIPPFAGQSNGEHKIPPLPLPTNISANLLQSIGEAGGAGERRGAKENRCIPSPRNLPEYPVLAFLPNTATILHRSPRNPAETNCCAEVYFQWRDISTQKVTRREGLLDMTYLDLLEQVIFEPFFDQLRTQQQLGYDVSCGVRQTHGMLGFCFKISSSKFDIRAILIAIMKFVSAIPQTILASDTANSIAVKEEEEDQEGEGQCKKEIDSKSAGSDNPKQKPKQKQKTKQMMTLYEQHVQSLRESKLTPPTSLHGAASKFWSEIEEDLGYFHTNHRQAELLLLSAGDAHAVAKVGNDDDYADANLPINSTSSGCQQQEGEEEEAAAAVEGRDLQKGEPGNRPFSSRALCAFAEKLFLQHPKLFVVQATRKDPIDFRAVAATLPAPFNQCDILQTDSVADIHHRNSAGNLLFVRSGFTD